MAVMIVLGDPEASLSRGFFFTNKDGEELKIKIESEVLPEMVENGNYGANPRVLDVTRVAPSIEQVIDLDYLYEG